MTRAHVRTWQTVQRSHSIDRAWKIPTIGLTLLFITATVPPLRGRVYSVCNRR